MPRFLQTRAWGKYTALGRGGSQNMTHKRIHAESLVFRPLA